MTREERAGLRSSASDGSPPPAEGTSAAEWAVAAAGAALLLLTLGYMAVYGLTHPDGPPVPVIERLSVERVGNAHLVRFRVTNAGNAAAAGLLVSGELRDGERSVEESEATLDYVPQQSSRDGGLFFSQDPSRFALTLRAKGYADP